MKILSTKDQRITFEYHDPAENEAVESQALSARAEVLFLADDQITYYVRMENGRLSIRVEGGGIEHMQVIPRSHSQVVIGVERWKPKGGE